MSGREIDAEPNFDAAARTIASMCVNYMTFHKIDRATFVSNLRIFANCIEKDGKEAAALKPQAKE